MEIS
jgi:hypothetical protein